MSREGRKKGNGYKRMYLELNLLEILLAGDDIEDFNPYTI
jgi:hypothetical protein